MWLFTRYGFYSVACARAAGKIDPETIMLRARSREHLEALKERFPELREFAIATSPQNDYRFRVVLPKKIWLGVLEGLGAEQDWSNFKSETARHQGSLGADYVDALHDVWSRMYRLQKG